MNTEIFLDRPEARAVLFYPRGVAKHPTPANAIDFDFPVADDVRIGGRLFPADKTAPTILFFHGNGETVQDYDDIGPCYVQQGINFLTVDYRGYGWSDGSPSASAMLRDSHTLLELIRKWCTENEYTGSLFLMGRSLGSACAIELAAAYNDTISGLIIESGFAETLPLARTLGLDPESYGMTEEDGFNNLRKIERVTKPTFILHGQTDTLIPVWQAEKLQAACGSKSKELQVMPRADHNSLIAVGGHLYFQTIKRYIDRVIGADDWRKRRRSHRGNKTRGQDSERQKN